MYDENVRYITGTLTPGWNRLKPGLRYAMLCGDGRPILFEQGDIGMQVERHSPWIPKENLRHSFAWIKGAAGPASIQQVTKFTKAVLQAMKDNGVAGQKLGVDFVDINMINIFKENKIDWVDGMTPMMERSRPGPRRGAPQRSSRAATRPSRRSSDRCPRRGTRARSRTTPARPTS